MSEALDRLEGINRLPIFPLPLVLLPNELLPLHIFEPRYRKMLEDVSEGAKMFGISYFEPIEEFIKKPSTGSIGCAAEVKESQTLPDGNSNILTIGLVRYRLEGYADSAEPYLIGDVEFFEDYGDEDDIDPLAEEIYGLFKRVAEAAHKLSGERGRLPEIPRAEPQTLSFLVSAAFNLENEQKYELLETRSTFERLERLREILSSSVDKMEESAEISKIAKDNGHTNKKIEL